MFGTAKVGIIFGKASGNSYFCRKIVRNMDQEAKIRELERRLDRQDRHQVIILLLILMLVITILLKVQ